MYFFFCFSIIFTLIKAKNFRIINRVRDHIRHFVRFGIIFTIKKREKHQWKSVTFSKVAGFILRSRFLNYQIAQSMTYIYLSMLFTNE